jgi:hypothetical protein
MTVSSETPYTEYNGDGSTTSFSIGFTYEESDDLVVMIRDESDSDNITETVQVSPTNYSIDTDDDEVDFISAPTSDEVVVIYRQTDDDQQEDYTSGDGFPAEAHEGALDKLARRMQDLEYRIRRALLFRISDQLLDKEIPQPKANYFIRFNASADGVELVQVPSIADAVEAPQVTTTERDALSPSNGWIVYNTTDGELQAYVGGSWGTVSVT